MTNHDDRLTLLTEGGDAAPVGEAGLRAGDLVGGYRIESVAGRGGMGIVYRATDPDLGRLVALKVISPERAGDPRFRELFVRESLNASALEHPNVIPIYRAGEDEGRLYIAMRFVDGVSLHDLIAEHGALPAGRTARILSRVAGALDAAHARGLIHRDVKPANILIADPDGDEHVYLTDFGLSTRAARDAAGGPGGWAGTLAYLAPEQIRGEPLDARTDVYALGCVLFHCLTGRVPFPGGEEVVPFAHLNEPVPRVTELAPDVPRALEDVVARAMAKRPEDRFGSAGELARAALAARFDIALCHSPAQAAAADDIAALLRERGLEPVPASGDGAAEAVRSSGACAVLLGGDGLGDWARDALAAATDLAERDRAFRIAAVLCPGGPEPLDPGLAFFATRPWADLRGGIEGGVEDLLRALRAASPPVLGATVSDTCPYRGLEAFGEEHADDFFGREDDATRVLERLRTGRFLAIVGASGSGKSSLLQAGIVPAIRRGALPGGESWRVLHLTPGARPLGALSAQLASLPGAGAPTAAELGAGPRAVDLAVARALEGGPPEERVLLAVDQMEEMFTLCGDAGEREAFIRALVYAATIPGGRTAVVAAMRADFYHRLGDHPELRTLVAARQHALGPLDTAGLRRAIEKPAARAGLELEPGLTRRILTDVSGRPGTLPLMEHLLYELWQRRRGSMLTLEAYSASGGVEGSLARRANAIFEGLSPERQMIARRILLRLTQPGEGTEDTRRRAELRELATSPEERPEVEAVVGALAEARLVTTGREEATDEPVVDVTHEALIRGWPELRAWIDEDREGLRLHRRLTDAASEWEAGGRDESLVYRGTRLELWDERDLSPLNDVEREFLAASREHAQRDRAARRRRVRVALGGLGAVVAIVSGLAAFGLVQSGNASEERDVAQSRQLAANARLQLGSDPELALLLALRAYQVEPTGEADEILRQATYASRVRFAFRGHHGAVWDIALDPSGRTVATAGADGTVRLWRVGESTAFKVLRGHTGEVRGVAVSPSGKSVASAGADGTVRLWNVADGESRVLRGHRGVVNSVAFSSDGARVVSAGDDGTVRVWSLHGGHPKILRGHEGAVRKAAFSPDGRRVASGGDDGTVRLWSASGQPLEVLRGHEGAVFGVAFDPGGRRIASASSDLTVRVWNPASTRPPLMLKAAAFSGVDDVAFSSSGSRLVTSGQDGTVRVWSSSGHELTVLRGHSGEVLSARFTPDRRRVVSSGFDGTVRVWDWHHGEPDAELSIGVPLAFSGGAEFAPDGKDILTGRLDGSVRRWRPGGAPPTVVVPPGPRGTVTTAVAYSRDGRRIAVAGVDGAVAIHDLDQSSKPSRLQGHQGPVWSMVFDRDGRRLFTGGDDGTVRVWSLDSSTAAMVLRGPKGAIQTVALSPDERRVAAAGFDGVVRIWDLAGGGPPLKLSGHEGTVYSLGFSPGGRRLVSGGADRTVRIWDLQSRRPTLLGRHETAVYAAAFSPNGEQIVSAASDGARVWDWAKGTVDFEYSSPARDVFSARFSPNGRRLAISTITDRIRVVSCETCGPIGETLALARKRVTRDLGPDEREAFGG